MYTMLFGQNPVARELLEVLGLRPSDVGRFRDAVLLEDCIAVYTRNGGGNREHYENANGTDAGEGCPCTGCIITFHLPKHPLYLRDQDDSFDNTYATVYFKFPAE